MLGIFWVGGGRTTLSFRAEGGKWSPAETVETSVWFSRDGRCSRDPRSPEGAEGLPEGHVLAQSMNAPASVYQDLPLRPSDPVPLPGSQLLWQQGSCSDSPQHWQRSGVRRRAMGGRTSWHMSFPFSWGSWLRVAEQRMLRLASCAWVRKMLKDSGLGWGQ